MSCEKVHIPPMPTIHEALQQAQKRLIHSSSARLDARWLLCDVLNVEPAYLISYGERELTQNEQIHFEAYIRRREQGDPVAYILGTVGFYDLELSVTPDVLIPRPETEQLVELAIAISKEQQLQSACDIGTGSGAIAVTVKKHVPSLTMFAVDVSLQALLVAQKNALTVGTDIQFYQGSLAQPLIDHQVKVDLLLANLPYIPSQEMLTLEVSKHEPHLALDGGDDGLDLVRQLIDQVPSICNPQATILLEIGAGQGQTVVDYAQRLSPKEAICLPDYAGHDRIVKIML